MLDHKERWIYFYKTFLKPLPEEAPYTKMADILGRLQPRCDKGECVKIIENNTAAVRIKEIRFDEARNLAIILFQYSDTKISDPAFVSLETGVLRVEPKLEGEGVAISAHMVVSLLPDHPRGVTYLTLLEDIPGMGKTKIEPFLRSEFKEVFGDKYRDCEGIMQKYRPTFEMAGFASESLKESLTRGHLKGFELRRYKHIVGGLDEEDYVKVESNIIKLKAKRHYEGDEAISVINWVKDKARQMDFSDMVVHYKRNEGKSKSVPVSTAREDAGDAMFSKFEIVKVNNPLPQCLSEINDEMAEKMSALLVASR